MTIACLLAVGGEPAQNLSIFDPVSPPAEAVRNLAWLVLAITSAILAIVEGILIYSVIRFRHGPPAPAGPGAEAGGSEPPQVYGSTPIEVAWTAAPALIVFVMTLVVARTLWEVETGRPPEDSKPLRITVIGHQWWWEYVYESYDGEKLSFVTANELRVPASNFALASERRPVYLKLQSADVAHSFWVPRLAGKTDLIPGRTNHMWFETGQTGLYLGQCAEYCGTQHAGMLLRVYVDTPEDFARWLENQKKDAIDDPAVSEGKRIFQSQSCVSCHRVRGTTAAGTFGPDLTHLMSRDTIASGMVANTRDNLHRWIVDPQKVKPGCLMPAFALTARDLDAIVDYLATLR